ncbi:hypothetical protein [Algoriphagus boritolerans]|uniref:hypothetical protein n=1 Tax=Algoriphagus boritolerans TaxID=308111 RepID=UPI002FCE3BBE
MKKLTLFIFAFAISTMTFSQEILMGPKFKNAPVGKVQGPRITLLHESSPASLQGPVAKNTEVWMARSAKKVTVGSETPSIIQKGFKPKTTILGTRRLQKLTQRQSMKNQNL